MLEIKKYLPNKLKVHHVKGHQDKNSRTKELTLSARLNIAADKLIGQNAKAPLMTNIKNTPIAVYVNNKYIPNNYVSAIRNHCGETEARNFMMTKYAWSSAVISNIEWQLLDNFIKRKSYSKSQLLTMNYVQLFLLKIAFLRIHFHNQVNCIIHCFPNLSNCEEQDKFNCRVL